MTDKINICQLKEIIFNKNNNLQFLKFNKVIKFTIKSKFFLKYRLNKMFLMIVYFL